MSDTITTGNLLQNGSFENGSYFLHDEHGKMLGTVEIAVDWHAWWDKSDAMPEYVVDDREPEYRVHSGEYCQHWFNSFKTHTAGILQRVMSDGHWVVGDRLIASGFAQTWTRHDFEGVDPDNPRESNGRYQVRFGIDPYGGLDSESPDVQWSEAIGAYDLWYEIVVSAIAKSDRVTFFVWSQPEWSCKHNDVYIDDCQLVAVREGSEPEPEPEPESTPDPEPDPGPGHIQIDELVNRISTASAIKTLAIVADALIAAGGLIKNRITPPPPQT